ncbi:hypothetical protein D9611_005786 [Ephemerocybe angulata]|uniref:Uncharacterized protein n=1 Tax=Ephemerocybe angulata TaxID=980116 RepID=A0A8H5BK13_9AGAR|nr:hypothetical protein D9611_005786 [Tulosesus angulatus]
MSAAPPPTLLVPREDWADTDFDIPDGIPLHAHSDKEDEDEDEDWDMEMDLGPTGGAKVKAVVAGMLARSNSSTRAPLAASTSQIITIRPPISSLDVEEDDEEGVSTIKATDPVLTLRPKAPKQPLPQIIDEDFEEGFALPSDLTKLSLVPQSLNHRSSKNSLEWGDKDSSTSSSQSSDAYSTLGFADVSPHSHSGTSVSLPDTETEEEDDDLEGLVIPNALFESKQSVRHLNKILETKKKADTATNQVQVATPNPEDDFEAGLIIEDDVDLSPSRLLTNSNPRRLFNRSSSLPQPRPSTLRPPSRPKLERSKSPSNPPPSSQRQLQKIRLSPSPPLRPPSRSQTFQAFGPPPPIPSPTPSPSSSFLTPKPGSLRGQKSHSGLKPPTPPSTVRKLSRKASLSVLESSQKQATRTSTEANNQPKQLARYEEPTVASKAKSHKNSTSRIHDFKVPPTRPSTPSSNTAALRLTMPTQSRIKSRPGLSQLFSQSLEPQPLQTSRAISPLPPRPPSSASLRLSSSSRGKAPTSTSPPATVAPKLLRKPKRFRTYGDGTELDGFDDLPLDQDKEGRFRVHPKGQSNRIPGSSFEKPFSKSAGDKPSEGKQGTIRRMKGTITSLNESATGILTPATNTLRRTTTTIDFPSRPPSKSVSEVLPKKRKNVSSPSKSSPGTTRRKPTLIRNLGGAAGPKVVGDMKYNPLTQRWEGNDQVLREFDAAMGTSTRPALITPFTGSTVGSPSGNYSNGARVVGNMYFDPQQMRWISTLHPDEEEPDVFANMADDEEDSDAWEGKSGTIRATANGPRTSDASSVASGTESVDVHMASAVAVLPCHSRTISDSGSDDRGSRASMHVGDIDEDFIEKCRQAEERHRTEMRGWKSSISKFDPYQPPNLSHLYEIRALATRKY